MYPNKSVCNRWTTENIYSYQFWTLPAHPILFFFKSPSVLDCPEVIFTTKQKLNSQNAHCIKFIFFLCSLLDTIPSNGKKIECLNQLCRFIWRRVRLCDNFDYGFVVILFKSRVKLSFNGKWFADKYIICCL